MFNHFTLSTLPKACRKFTLTSLMVCAQACLNLSHAATVQESGAHSLAKLSTEATKSPLTTQGYAIVLREHTALRSAARDSGQTHAQLTSGDVLEVRGERMDYLQVYDYRRERAGFVKASNVKRLVLSPQEAPELLALIRHVRDAQGQETLGIGLTAAYLKATTQASEKFVSQAQQAEVFEALGTMAERIALRASSLTATNKAQEASVAAQLELAKTYGLQFESHENEGRLQVCYDQAAFKQVMEMSASAQQKAIAALARTRPECLAFDPLPSRRLMAYQWAEQLLAQLEMAELPVYLKNRVLLRRAYYANGLAFHTALAAQREIAEPSPTRKHEPMESKALRHANAAQNAFALVQRNELPDEDIPLYNDVAMRLGATRWAHLTNTTAALAPALKHGLSVQTETGASGEVCLKLVDSKLGAEKPVLRRCSYGLLWTQSVSINAQGSVITLAAQPLEGWREMWVMRKTGEGWVLDVLPPSTNTAELGYVEFAGFSPDGQQVLVAREAKTGGRHKRSFEVLNANTLNTEKLASEPGLLNAFVRWQDVRWKAHSLSLR